MFAGFIPREHGKFGQRLSVQATEALSDFEKLQSADRRALNNLMRIGALQDNTWDPKNLEDREVNQVAPFITQNFEILITVGAKPIPTASIGS